MEQRRVEDLIARYRLEPTLNDLYVEGAADAAVLNWFLSENGAADVGVYPISTVLVPAETIANLGLPNNNKGRVIALASALSPYINNRTGQATCIADRDLDIILERTYDERLLLLTDYTCVEMYLYNTAIMAKFLRLNLPTFPKTAGYVIQELTPVLQDLFLARLANDSLALGLKAVDFERYCAVANAGLVFDSSEYVRNYLTTNGQAPRIQDFRNEMERFRPLLRDDARVQINGHDFIDLLAWYLRNHRVPDRQLFRSEFTRRLLFSCVEAGRLSDEAMFQALLARLQGRA